MSCVTFVKNHSLHSPLLSSVALSLGLLLGCGAGQIGGEVENSATGNECEEVGSEPVSGDETTSVGLSVSQLASVIDGTHETTLSWGGGDGSGFGDVTVTPASGDSTIVVTVASDPGSARVIDWEPATDSGDRQTLAGTQCEDELVIDAEVTVVTDNGALNDTFLVTFATSNSQVISTSIDLEPGQLEGSFDVEVSGPLPNGEASQTRLNLNFAFGLMSGEISGTIQSSDGVGAVLSGITYGKFPADSACEFGLPIDDQSTWAQDLEARLLEYTEFDFTWQGGTSTEMTLSPELGSPCYVESYIDFRTMAPLMLSVATADDSITGTWNLDLGAEVDKDGRVQSVRVSRNNGNTFENLEFEASTGITGVESTAERLSFTFGYTIDPTLSVGASGELTILEIMVPECAQPDYEPPVDNGGTGSPGCQGVDANEIKNGTFVAR